MKYLFIAFLLLISPTQAHAYHLVSERAHIDITTDKVISLEGEVDSAMEMRYIAQKLATDALPGPRVLLINSPGGYVDSGENIIQILESERAAGTQVICVVTGMASSMAFNLLTHCDVRLSVAKARMVVHKIAVGGLNPFVRGTAQNLRRIADEMDEIDEKYCVANAAAMHLARADYDKFADLESNWTPEELLSRGYLNDIVTLR